MGNFKVKTKYYLYGLAIGIIVATLCHGLWAEISLIDLKSVLSWLIIIAAFLIAGLFFRVLYIRRNQYRMILRCRYFYQPTYRAIIGFGFLLAIVFYKEFLASYVNGICINEKIVGKDIQQFTTF